jgi:hypothetical protein
MAKGSRNNAVPKDDTAIGRSRERIEQTEKLLKPMQNV